jgi:hypothetical protein
LIGQQAIRLLPVDSCVERLPREFRVKGANDKEVVLMGVVRIEVTFVGQRGLRHSLALKCAIAPEFDGGLLLSMGTMEALGTQINERNRSSIHFKVWGLTIPVRSASQCGMLHLKTSRKPQKPVLVEASTALAYCRQKWCGEPTVVRDGGGRVFEDMACHKG